MFDWVKRRRSTRRKQEGDGGAATENEPSSETTLVRFSLFSNLNNDCKVQILSFLSIDDLNSFAECSRDCYRVRANESLDQTRTATIVLTRKSTFQSFLKKTSENRQVFTGNRTRLKIVGSVPTPRRIFPIRQPSQRNRPASQTGQVFSLHEEVTSLDLSVDLSVIVRGCQRLLFHFYLCRSFPNLQTINISSQIHWSRHSAFLCGPFCPLLSQITWYNCDILCLTGSDFENITRLTHLYLDGSTFVFDAGDINPFVKCQSLEFLSIKGCYQRQLLQEPSHGPLSQDMLIEMVRRHPTLRWLRSDLTPENVEMLKRERPDMTFVSD